MCCRRPALALQDTLLVLVGMVLLLVMLPEGCELLSHLAVPLVAQIDVLQAD